MQSCSHEQQCSRRFRSGHKPQGLTASNKGITISAAEETTALLSKRIASCFAFCLVCRSYSDTKALGVSDFDSAPGQTSDISLTSNRMLALPLAPFLFSVMNSPLYAGTVHLHRPHVRKFFICFPLPGVAWTPLCRKLKLILGLLMTLLSSTCQKACRRLLIVDPPMPSVQSLRSVGDPPSPRKASTSFQLPCFRS